MGNKPTIPEQHTQQYLRLIDEHLADLEAGRTDAMYEIEDFAKLMFMHPTHLSNTIKEVTGASACGHYQMKILDTAKKLLKDTDNSITDIALLLTFDPSQFTKWFKRFAGITPREFRKLKP